MIEVDPVPAGIVEARSRLDDLVRAMMGTTNLNEIKVLAGKVRGLSKRMQKSLTTGEVLKVEALPEPTAEVKPKRVKPKSRVQRWSDACGNARTALDQLIEALDELNEIKGEFEEWQGNLPENLQQSALGEKLQAIVDLDFESATSDIESVIDEAEGAELPLGFGRD